MNMIAVANQKGGVGKTTTSICIAQELRRRERRVLLIDTDPQGTASMFYEAKMQETATFADILYGDMNLLDCVQHTAKGDIVASDEQLNGAENIVRPDELRFYHLKNALKDPKIKEQYDYIIIDTPPAIGVILKNVLAVTPEVIVPIQESGWSLAGIMAFYAAIQMAQQTTNPDLQVKGILTVMAHTNTRRSKEVRKSADALAQTLQTQVFHTTIRESTKCVEALTLYFVPLHQYAPYCTTAVDYEDFVSELYGEED